MTHTRAHIIMGYPLIFTLGVAVGVIIMSLVIYATWLAPLPQENFVPALYQSIIA